MTSGLRLIAAAVLMGAALAAVGHAAAQPYPSRPVRIIVPFPAGGPTDVQSRILAEKLSQRWQQQVIVDDRPGGNTIIGAVAVAKAMPDGYTLLMAIDSTLVMNQYLYATLPYDPLKDFAPITRVVRGTLANTEALGHLLLAHLKSTPLEAGDGAGASKVERASAAPGSSRSKGEAAEEN